MTISNILLKEDQTEKDWENIQEFYQNNSIDFVFEKGWNGIFYAVMKNNVKLLKFFIKNQANIDQFYFEKKFSLLHIATIYQCYDVMIELITAGLNINQQDIDGRASLMFALQNLDIIAIDILKHHKASFLLKDNEEKSVSDYIQVKRINPGESELMLVKQISNIVFECITSKKNKNVTVK